MKKWYWLLDPYVLLEEMDLTGQGVNILMGLIFLLGLAIFAPGVFEFILQVVVLLAPVWLPIVAFLLFKKYWMNYVQGKTYLETPRAMLEIRIPRDVAKSPKAMETVLNVFFHTGDPETLYARYIEGKMRPQFSLEIVSLAGDVRFYIQSPVKHQEIVKAQIYSQYPGIEIFEVDDYMNQFRFDLNAMDIFGIEMTLREPDPYPIKTYIDFGLDKDPKEEFQVDPISGILEFLGSMGPGEYACMQVVIRSHDKNEPEKRPENWWKSPKTWFVKEDWNAEAKRITEKLIKGMREESTSKNSKGEEVKFSMHRGPTEEEKMLIESLGRNTAKKPFDTGIRVIYFADNEHFNGDQRNAGLPTMFRQFESHTLNGLKPRFPTRIKYKLHDPLGRRKAIRKERIFNAYRTRSFFIAPYPTPYFVLSSEELATIYHFPLNATVTPGLQRIAAKKAEAPPNLPLQ